MKILKPGEKDPLRRDKNKDVTTAKFENELFKIGIIDLKYDRLYSKIFDIRQKGTMGIFLIMMGTMYFLKHAR